MKNLFKDPYLLLNAIFTGIIFIIFMYSAIFSAERDNHPIPSYYEKFTGKTSPTSGLSRSFSAIIRFRFEEARKWNQRGIEIFLFFFIQLFLRLITSTIIIKKIIPRRLVTRLDGLVSIILLCVCFQDLLFVWRYMQFNSLFHPILPV